METGKRTRLLELEHYLSDRKNVRRVTNNKSRDKTNTFLVTRGFQNVRTLEWCEINIRVTLPGLSVRGPVVSGLVKKNNNNSYGRSIRRIRAGRRAAAAGKEFFGTT